MAIALTLGLIAWIENPDTHGCGSSSCSSSASSGSDSRRRHVRRRRDLAFARLPASVGAFAPVASLAAAALSFGAADVIGGSGFLAVYLVGLAIGSTPSRYRRQLVGFHEGIAFLAQVALFIVLGLLVFPSHLTDVAGSGLGTRAAPRLRRPTRRRLGVHGAQRLQRARTPPAGLGRAARRSADRARDVRPLLARRQTRTRSSTPSSSSSSSRSSCKARPSNVSRGDSTCFRRLARPTSHRSRSASRARSIFWTSWSHPITPSQALPSERWASREPRSSPSSFGATARSHLGGARSSSQATASSCSSRIRCAPRSKTSSLAGSGGSREA